MKTFAEKIRAWLFEDCASILISCGLIVSAVNAVSGCRVLGIAGMIFCLWMLIPAYDSVES